VTGIYPHLFFFLAFTFSVILFGVTVFALSAPQAFAQWFSPWSIIMHLTKPTSLDSWNRVFAYAMGLVSLVSLLGLCFGFGIFFVRVFF